jgi:hypothetical protein
MKRSSPSLQEFGYKQEPKRALTLRDLIVFGMIFIESPQGNR